MKLSLPFHAWFASLRPRSGTRRVTLRPATLPRPRTLSARSGPTDLRGPVGTLRKGRIADWYPSAGSVISPDPRQLTG